MGSDSYDIRQMTEESIPIYHDACLDVVARERRNR